MNRKDFSDIQLNIQKNQKPNFEHEDYIAGTPPFLRGMHSTMYIQKPLISNFIIDKTYTQACNLILKDKITEGYKEFILEFKSENQPNGIQLNTVDDMIALLTDIPLNEVSIILNINNTLETGIISFFLIAADELGFSKESLNLSIQHNSNNLILEKIIDTLLFDNNYFQVINSIRISKSNINEDATPEFTIASTISEISNYFKTCTQNGLKIDKIASKFSLNLNLTEDYFFDIALMRATRLVWSKMIHFFQTSNQNPFGLQIHINNCNSYLNTLTSIFGGAQSITSSNRNAFFIEKETFITKTVDPWGGSNFIEKLTQDLSTNIWELFLEIQEKELN